MNPIRNLNLKHKLVLMLVVPLLALAGLSALLYGNASRQAEDAERMVPLVQMATVISRAEDALLKEYDIASRFLKARGKPGPFNAANLAVAAGRSLLTRQSFEPGDIDEVILGCVMPGPDEANIGRVTALRLGISEETPAWTVQRNCASGMQALDSAAQSIAHGRANLVLAGGVEAMSHAPVLLAEPMVVWLAEWYKAKGLGARAKALRSLRPAYLKPVIALLRGLTDPVVGLSMGQTAEIIAHRFGIEREQMDAYAMRSHQRLAAAQDAGYLQEIETLFDTAGHYFDADDGLRRDSSLASLGKLKPVLSDDANMGIIKGIGRFAR